MSWRLLAAAIRRHDPTRFLARIELLAGLRLVLDEAPALVRADSRLVFGALDDTEVTLRALRAALSIHGRNPNPAAAARIRKVLVLIAADLDAAEATRRATVNINEAATVLDRTLATEPAAGSRAKQVAERPVAPRIESGPDTRAGAIHGEDENGYGEWPTESERPGWPRRGLDNPLGHPTSDLLNGFRCSRLNPHRP